MAKRGPRDDRDGGGKRRRAAAKAARKAEREVARAGAELRKIELRLVEAQVILAEVTVRADALQDRLRELAVPGSPVAGGQPAHGASIEGTGDGAVDGRRMAEPLTSASPGDGWNPAIAPVPRPEAAPATDAASAGTAGDAERADTAPQSAPDPAMDVAPHAAPGSLPGEMPGPVRPVVDLASRWGDEPF